MKKTLFLIMSVFCTFGLYSANVKSAEVTISNVTTGNNSQYGQYVQYTVTTNDDIAKLGIIVTAGEQLTKIYTTHRSASEMLSVFEQIDAVYSGFGQSIWVNDPRPNTAYTQISPNLDEEMYEICVVAVGNDSEGNIDTNNVFFTSYIVTFADAMGGGEGEAVVNAEIYDITATSANVQFTVNDQTAYYYFTIQPDDSLQSWGINSLEDYKAHIDELILASKAQKATADKNGPLPDLTEKTSYTVYALPYNANRETGTGDMKTFTTWSVNLTDVFKTNLTVFPNPATEIIQISSVLPIEKINLYNASFQTVYSQHIFSCHANIDISHFAKGIYTLEIISNKNRIVKQVIIQ